MIFPTSIEDPCFEAAYIYDGTVEGLLSAIFAAYAHREEPTDLAPEGAFQARLGQRAVRVETNPSQAERVHDGIVRLCGKDAFDMVKCAALSDEAQAGMAAYRFVRHAMGTKSHPGAGKHALSDITHPAVEPLVRIARAVGNERHYMMQFLRFTQVEGGVWVARCAPKASVVPLLMDWFSARFNTQPFVIYDEAHRLAGVYEGLQTESRSIEAASDRVKGGAKNRRSTWYLVRTDILDTPPPTSDEVLMSRAWNRFYDTIAVESRYNPELRRQNMPKRLWKHITEMRQDGVSDGNSEQSVPRKPSSQAYETPVRSNGGMKLSSQAPPSCQK